MESTVVEFTLLFEDDTTQKLSIGPIDSEFTASASINKLKSDIRTYMNEFNSDTAQLAISKYGNNWAGFDSVKVITTETNILF